MYYIRTVCTAMYVLCLLLSAQPEQSCQGHVMEIFLGFCNRFCSYHSHTFPIGDYRMRKRITYVHNTITGSAIAKLTELYINCEIHYYDSQRERERERESLHNVIQLTSSTGSRGRGSVWSDRSPSHCLLGCRRHPLHNTNTDRQTEHLFTEYVPSICIYTMLIDTCHVRTCARTCAAYSMWVAYESEPFSKHTHTHTVSTNYTHNIHTNHPKVYSI